MDLESLLSQYGQAHHLGKLQLNTSGICSLFINKKYLITFERSIDPNGFYLYSDIGIVPAEKEKQFSLMALKGNLFGKETGRANIGYIEETQTLVLFEYFDIHTTDYPHFVERLNQFVKYLAYWIVKMQSPEHEDAHKNQKKHSHFHEHHHKVFYP